MDITKNDIQKRYNGLVETTQELGERVKQLTIDNTFLRNEKAVWGEEKNKQTTVMVVTINRFNSQITNLNEEIVRAR